MDPVPGRGTEPRAEEEEDHCLTSRGETASSSKEGRKHIGQRLTAAEDESKWDPQRMVKWMLMDTP